MIFLSFYDNIDINRILPAYGEVKRLTNLTTIILTMAYEVLARKYRPKTFGEVIGQEHIVKTLSNSISQGRIHHAYLFSGARGTGKTTTARLLAKALSCEKGPTSDVCQSCDACVGISGGNFVDVQEIDGASNRGIDEIRNLRENIRFAPVSGRYKVYIIDEAHQITGAAFNALLKTLEEPPKHAVFILATTEPQSIPPTIASRCQRYNFRLLTSDEIVSSLEKIIKNENILAEPNVLTLMAKYSGGSMRDAQSLLDQAISYSGNKLTMDSLRELLGVLPENFINDTFSAVSGSDSKKIIECLNDVVKSGHDLSLFISEMLSYSRLIILDKIGVESNLSDFEKEVVEKHEKNFSVEEMLRISKMLLKCKEEMRWSDDPKFLFELYLVKLTMPFLDADELKKIINCGTRKDENNVQNSHDGAKIIHKSAIAAKGDAAVADVKGFWSGFLASIPSSEGRLKNALGNSRLENMKESSIELEVQSEFALKELKSKQDVALNLLSKYAGKSFSVEFILKKDKNRDSPSIEKEEIPNDGEEHHSDGLKKIIDVFPGKIEKIISNK